MSSFFKTVQKILSLVLKNLKYFLITYYELLRDFKFFNIVISLKMLYFNIKGSFKLKTIELILSFFYFIYLFFKIFELYTQALESYYPYNYLIKDFKNKLSSFLYYFKIMIDTLEQFLVDHFYNLLTVYIFLFLYVYVYPYFVSYILYYFS